VLKLKNVIFYFYTDFKLVDILTLSSIFQHKKIIIKMEMYIRIPIRVYIYFLLKNNKKCRKLWLISVVSYVLSKNRYCFDIKFGANLEFKFIVIIILGHFIFNSFESSNTILLPKKVDVSLHCKVFVLSLHFKLALYNSINHFTIILYHYILYYFFP
jgi:hypothetical protein